MHAVTDAGLSGSSVRARTASLAGIGPVCSASAPITAITASQLSGWREALLCACRLAWNTPSSIRAVNSARAT
jgi:hypothetical protein